MKTIFIRLFFAINFIILICSVQSCTKDKTSVLTDKELYDLAKSTSNFTWFKNSNAFLPKSSGSGHAPPKLRVRFNSVAATKLDANGKIIPGSLFPQGSLIVKELCDDSGKLIRYAILYKNPESEDADDLGWVWGYINENGSVTVSATEKGTSCISCHSQSENIDYMLMNKYFP